MNLQFFDGKINDSYAWEFQIFYKYRDFSDGIDFFKFDIEFDKYICDHNPKFDFSLKMFNFIIFDFGIYNVYHTDNPNSPYFGMNDGDEDLTFDDDFDADVPNYEKDNHD